MIYQVSKTLRPQIKALASKLDLSIDDTITIALAAGIAYVSYPGNSVVVQTTVRMAKGEDIPAQEGGGK